MKKKPPTADKIDRWIRRVLTAAKIETVRFHDQSLGLVRVPAKYVAVIDALHAGMVAIAHGDPLPDLAEPPAKKLPTSANALKVVK
jgi:hypothetical protein